LQHLNTGIYEAFDCYTARKDPLEKFTCYLACEVLCVIGTFKSEKFNFICENGKFWNSEFSHMKVFTSEVVITEQFKCDMAVICKISVRLRCKQ
jgi:hypothetical protein